MIFNQLVKYKGVISFSGLKYLEIAITALTTFLVAEKIGSVEFGKSVETLLFITYSSYLSLGVNQVIIKNFSKFPENNEKHQFLRINFQYILIASISCMPLAFVALNDGIWALAALISAASLLKSFFMAYFRVTDKIWILNKNNIVFSALLLVLSFLFVNTWQEYLCAWVISLWLSLIIYIYDARVVMKTIFISFFYQISISNLKWLFKEGANLSIVSVIITLYLTVDRLLFTNSSFSENIKGSYQLADYFGMALYMLLTTILFYYYPKLIAKLREDFKFRSNYISKLRLVLMGVIPLIFSVYFFIVLIQLSFFIDYPNLAVFVSLNVLIKSLVFVSSIIGLFYISLDLEKTYIKLCLPTVLVILALLVFSWSELLVFGISLHIPILICGILIIDVGYKWLKVSNFIILR